MARLGRGRSPAWLLAGFLWALASGCATYSESFLRIERDLAARQPARALEVLEKQCVPDRDELLYVLNRAMLLRMTGNLEESNREFEKGKTLVQRLSALSIREQATAFVINDASRAYSGAPFEQVLIHLYEALNYLEMGELDSARVEALQVDVRLGELLQLDPDSAFSVDPFARYLTGLIYEELEEWSDAMIAYRKAYQAYQAHQKLYPIRLPSLLKIDLLRLAEKLELENELDEYRQTFRLESWPPLPAGNGFGEIVFILHNGLAPIKREQSITAPIPSSGQIVRVSLPRYEKRRLPVQSARMKVGGESASSERMEDINSIAVRTLEAHMPAITARAVARAALKYVVVEGAKKKNEWAGVFVNVAGLFIERADTRSWLTLPGEIQMARLPLAPGTYDIQVDLLGRGGATIDRREFADVRVEPRAKTYLSYHYISSLSTRH